jgi:hydroxymethylpyrimidine pyrophosphatase-like HAD family hydrolase
MGKQINFYMAEETEAKFIDFVISTGGKVLFKGDNDKPIYLTSLPKDDWYQLYLYKEEFGQLTLRPISDNKYYIDSINSPVIEFSRTYKREIGKNKEISRGRIWVEMKFWNEQEELEEKTKELEKWYGTLNRWIKKNVDRVDEIINGHKYITYVSPSLKELMSKGYKFM